MVRAQSAPKVADVVLGIRTFGCRVAVQTLKVTSPAEHVLQIEMSRCGPACAFGVNGDAFALQAREAQRDEQGLLGGDGAVLRDHWARQELPLRRLLGGRQDFHCGPRLCALSFCVVVVANRLLTVSDFGTDLGASADGSEVADVCESFQAFRTALTVCFCLVCSSQRVALPAETQDAAGQLLGDGAHSAAGERLIKVRVDS